MRGETKMNSHLLKLEPKYYEQLSDTTYVRSSTCKGNICVSLYTPNRSVDYIELTFNDYWALGSGRSVCIRNDAAQAARDRTKKFMVDK